MEMMNNFGNDVYFLVTYIDLYDDKMNEGLSGETTHQAVLTQDQINNLGFVRIISVTRIY